MIIVKNILAVILGVIAGGMVVAGFETCLHILHPMPSGIDPHRIDLMNAYIETIPLWLMITILICWCIAAWAAGYTAKKIGATTHIAIPIIVGLLLTAASTANLLTYKHPLWFMVCGIILWIPFAWKAYHHEKNGDILSRFF